ncbi:MAG: diguanylate cyclase [gamma proteobacterium symbiont of Bathyaustriella thionipta]|nr:diguanylate cyclase [gamma proteobacterium symbiont of Bathyaustriella thionipta]MCU7950768.1 diguanylate cyclase [gamma proteobacterium symbiont of Bathyaustriella thionipta]MCU7952064.1 diguanylate cyclase [gamma proteobacterium symbiont of Bathyaustriella thionipta]MCU7957272.1 diguanylate cyclase [gamma proteobacterium symbiont of Bathyaustriella thionipta]MCU7966236.1 diguanylate cyclase [gamma proteobacterium symbiont of Bathyaustriella thionipta]
MNNIEQQTTCFTHFPSFLKDDASEACLVRIYPHSIGDGIFHLPQETINIGRDKNCHLELADQSVSRQHAQIEFSENRFIISDSNSCNSTFINDKKIAKSHLTSGDLIRIGHTIFKFLSCGHIEKQYHEEIYSMMINDGLTNIPNKRFFMEMLEREVTRSQRHQRPLSLIIFDIDHFKCINDQYGHLSGDIVLRDLCQRIKPYIRKDELFARYGGEEFVILLPETNSEQALSFAEKILSVTNSRDFIVENVSIPTTISMGISQINLAQTMSAKDLIQNADKMLYKAKNNGRNCICVRSK